MKAVILAGEYGTRPSEGTAHLPEPMVEIGEDPIVWNIFETCAARSITDTDLVCCGYKEWIIKEHFAKYAVLSFGVTFDLAHDAVGVHRPPGETWWATLADTTSEMVARGPIQRARPYLDKETSCLTYGDGAANVNLATSSKIPCASSPNSARHPGYTEQVFAAADFFDRPGRSNLSDRRGVADAGVTSRAETG